MKLLIRSLAVSICIVLNIHIAQADELGSLEDQMKKMSLDTTLIVQSQGIDEYPIWSEDGKFLAANVMSKWYKIDLEHLSLMETKWRDGQSLGVLDSASSISEATPNEIQKFMTSTLFKPREYVTLQGKKFQLKQKGMKTEFVITGKGDQPIVKWSSSFENCHSLTANKKEKFIAFICEQNGVFVYMINE